MPTLRGGQRLPRPVSDDAQEPPEEDTLADAVRRISAALHKLAASGLTQEAIVVLVHDDTKLAKGEIRTVLHSLDTLAHKYTK